jgi:prefoldin beta subunit
MTEKHDHVHEHAPMVLPPAAQQLLLQLQTFQQQYQNVSIQRETLAIQKMEVDKALEELEKLTDKEEVFKAVGPLLIKSTKAALVKEMGEKGESIDVRLKSTDAQEKKLRERIDELQHKLQAMLGGPEGHVEPGESEGESAG